MEDNEFEEVTIISHTPMETINTHVEIVARKLIEKASLEITQKSLTAAEIIMLHYRSPLYELTWRNYNLHFNLNEPISVSSLSEMDPTTGDSTLFLTHHSFLGQPGWHVHTTDTLLYFRNSKLQVVTLDHRMREEVLVGQQVADFGVEETATCCPTKTSSLMR